MNRAMHRALTTSSDSAAGHGGSLLGLLPDDLCRALHDDGVDIELAEARRILARAISEGADDCAPQKRPVRARVLAAVRARFDQARPRLVETALDEDDGFEKLLFEHHDGARTEAVLIPLEAPGRFSVCLSSQVGCAMGCTFCATGELGLTRNLTAGEIVGSFLEARAHLRARELTNGRPEPRLRSAVFMGQGEPLHNYDEVVQAAYVLADPCGGRVRAENISISTVGLIDRIRRFTAEGHPFRLVVSLTSAVTERRRRLLPVAGQLDLDDLARAIVEHAAATGKRTGIAWVLLGGENTGADEVERLRDLFAGAPVRLSLIDYNGVEGGNGFQRAGDVEREAFRDGLSTLGIPFLRRYSGGRGKKAACGMLASSTTTSPSPSQEPGANA